MNSLGFGLSLSALALGSFVEQINYNDNSIIMDNQNWQNEINDNAQILYKESSGPDNDSMNLKI